MRTILNITIGLALLLTFNSCSDFLDTFPKNAIDENTALNNANDLQVATTGLYATIRSSGFLGRNYIAFGDVVGDVSTKKYNVPVNYNFDLEESLIITDATVNISGMWIQMYRAVDRSTRVILGGEALRETAVGADRPIIESCIAQAYTVRALSLFCLTNVFALPYKDSASAKETLGVVNVDRETIKPGQAVERKTLYDNYQLILSDINAAKAAWTQASPQNNLTLISRAATLALEARVRLYMKDWNGAIAAAEAAIEERGGEGLVYDRTAYANMWNTLTPSSEDIFTLTTNMSESLGASSLANLYLGLMMRLTPRAAELFAPNDMRWSIIRATEMAMDEYSYRPLKYLHVGFHGVHNVPVFRLPEMYLILAEAYNETGMGGATTMAREKLLHVARRNPAITAINQIPSSREGVRQFIREERVRELHAEGHRLYDMRRTGELLNKDEAMSNVTVPIVDFDISKLAFPIPQTEINASGIQQNDWANNLPIR
jgi:hypothetical protein